MSCREPFRPIRYSPLSTVLLNRATPASSWSASGRFAESPSGPLSPAVSPAALAGKNSSTGSPTRSVCRSGFATEYLRNSCQKMR